MKPWLLITSFLIATSLNAQQANISGRVTNAGSGLETVSIRLLNTAIQTITDSNGFYHMQIPLQGHYTLVAERVGYNPFRKKIHVSAMEPMII
ncbi:MAG: carboxypeptidase-like regulatory domain-containing protein, partial [Sediminibacterium sp.]